jgi:hypothetical protein
MSDPMASRRSVLIALGLGATALAAGWLSVSSTPSRAMTVFKSPSCTCCEAWIEHVRRAGFVTTTVVLDEDALAAKKRALGVSDAMSSCHTGTIGGYAVEGHVPAEDVARLLKERPDALGLAVPGMPLGSPGMEAPGQSAERYNVMLLNRNAAPSVFAVH